jgi:UDP-glucose 4-epimerase
MRASIFRFVSILGDRYTHGHVFDFYRQLKDHPDYLDVLGDGHQRKSYLHVQDCVAAILTAIAKMDTRVKILNLGVDHYCEVRDSIRWICERLCVSPRIQYAGGDRGWVGDSPFIFLDCARIRALGWTPQFDIQQGIVQTLEFLQNNEWVFDCR